MDPNWRPNDKQGKKPRNEGKNEEKLSRALAKVLRHEAVSEGLRIDGAGYILVDEMMAYLSKKGFKDLDFKDIERAVTNNDKKRFQLKEDCNKMYIRATQGHTMKQVSTEELLKLIEDPTEYQYVVHGTYLNVWPLIKAGGLNRMARNHIHFAPGLPKEQGVISGMRGSCQVYITIDMAAAMKDGIKFYISSNNVILTEGINGVLPPKYFSKVVSKQGNVMFVKENNE